MKDFWQSLAESQNPFAMARQIRIEYLMSGAGTWSSEPWFGDNFSGGFGFAARVFLRSHPSSTLDLRSLVVRVWFFLLSAFLLSSGCPPLLQCDRDTVTVKCDRKATRNPNVYAVLTV